MAISEFEVKRCEREMAKYRSANRPPEHSRNELDIGYRLDKQSIEIFEARPQWDDSFKKTETPVAKATFVKTQKAWRIFRTKNDMKWHRYDPVASVKYLEEFLTVVTDSENCCFWC